MKDTKWESVVLSNYCSKIGSGATPRGGDSVYQDHGIALIRSQNVYNGVFQEDGLAHIGDEHAKELDGVTVMENDILLNITGDSVARCCQVPASLLPARVNQHVAIVRPDPEELNPTFLRYYLISPYMQSYMLSLAGGGGTRKALTKVMIENFTVPKPPIDVQRTVSECLQAYDDLIENNRRQITLLDEAASQLYQEWFVRLRFPGHENSKIIDGVPEGWNRHRVRSLSSFLSRGITPDYDDDAAGLVINQKCIRRGRVDMTLARRQRREFKSDRQVQIGDVLINSTGEGTLGRVAQVHEFIPNCTVDTHVTIVRPADDAFLHFIGLSLMSKESLLASMGRGATNQTELSRDDIGNIEISLPGTDILKAFETFAEPIFKRRVCLVNQNEKLGKIRDLLLPRLMSGEITV